MCFRLSSCIGFFALTLTAFSADRFWDGLDTTGDADGGNGIWDTVSANWDDFTLGGSSVTWTNGDNAFFGGSPGTVTLAESITAGIVQFDLPGFTVDTATQAQLWTALAGTGGFTKAGSSTLTLAGPSPASGTVTISGGKISLGDNTALGTCAVILNGGQLERNTAGANTPNNVQVEGAGSTIIGRLVVDDYAQYSGVLSGNGSLTIQGLVRLTNPANTHSGPITVASTTPASYLRLSASELLGNLSAVVLGGTGANLRLDGGVTETVGSLAGTGTVFVSKSGPDLAGTLKFGGDNSSTSFTGQLNNNDGQLTLVKQGTGTFTLSPTTATYQNLIVSSGVVSCGNGTFGTNATITLGDADTGSNSVQFTTTGSGCARPIVVSASGSGTATIGTIAGTGNAAFSGQITLNRASTLTGGSTDRTTYTGRITGNAGTLTIAGGQRTVFESASGLNDFTGDVVISGTNTVLQIGAGTLTGENIPDASNVTVGAGALWKLASSAGGTETINALNGSGIVRRHEGVGGLQTLVVGAADGSGSFAGPIQNGGGSLRLVKNGTGTQTITSSANGASGGVVVNGGTLRLNAASVGFNTGVFGGTTAFTVNAGATLEIGNTWNAASTNTFTLNAATLTFTLAGTEPNANYVNSITAVDSTISGNAFRTGNNTAATHTFTGDLGNTLGASLGMVKNGATQTVTLSVADGAADNDLTVSGVIHDVTNFGGSTLVKTGPGKMLLTAANTYSGPTLVSQGAVWVRNGSGLGTSGTVTLGDASTGASTPSLILDTAGAGSHQTLPRNLVVAAVPTGTTVIGTTASSPLPGNLQAVFSGTLALADDLVMRTGAGDQTKFSGAFSGTGNITIANGSLTGDTRGNAGNRVIWDGAAKSFTGDITVQGGTPTNLTVFQINANNIVPDTCNLTIEPNAVLRLYANEGINNLVGGGRVRGVVNTYTLTVGAGNGSSTFDGVMENDPHDGGTLALAKAGTGAFTLTAASTYTGSTNVNNGTLVVNGSLGGTSGVTVGAAGRLAGTGSVAGASTVNGSVAPGTSVGTLTSTGSVNLGPNSVYEWEVGDWSGSAPGTDWDLLAANMLALTATDGQDLVIRIGGPAVHFSETNKSFVIANAATTLTGFDASAITIDPAAFVAATGAAGSWSVRQTLNTLELVYTATPATPYDTWASDHGLTGADRALDADPDHDGVANVIEFVTDSDPSTGSSLHLPTLADHGSTVTFTFLRRDDAESLAPFVEIDPELQDPWTVAQDGVNCSILVTENGADPDIVEVTIPKSGQPALFARLKITTP